MPWTPERSTINQTLQFGVETTPGVNVAANKLIQCFAVTLGPMADVAQFEATGRKYPTIVIENSEWVEGTLTGELDYNGIVYALAGTCGAPTSIVASGPSLTATLSTFAPPLTASLPPQT